MTAARVGVPVPMIYGGIAAMVVLLVAVGYFAGRASSGAATPAATAATPASAAASPPGARAEDRSGADAPAGTAAAPATATFTAPAFPANATTSAAPAGAIGAPAATMPPAMRREVAEYFRRMDAAQGAAKTWSDPTALAQEVLGQAMNGDSAGFDKLVAANAAARDGVRAITPPAPCAEHHRLTLALLDEAVVIVARLRDGVAAGDASAITAVATSSSAVEGRARAVDLMAASLKKQYGLEATP